MTIVAPKTSIFIGKATKDLGLNPHRVLFVGRYTEDVYLKNVLLKDIEDSHVKNMILKFREINTYSELNILGIAGTSPKVNATATLSITDGFDVDTVLKISILDNDLMIEIPANTSSADALTLIKTKLLTSQYVMSITGADILTITTTLTGLLGNNIYFAANNSNVVTTAFGGGTGIDTVDFTQIGTDRYQTIIYSSEFDTKPLDTLLTQRFNVPNYVLDGIGIYATYSTDADNYNNPCLIRFCAKKIKQHIDMEAVVFGAIRSLRLTDGANLVGLVDNSAGVDNRTGGINMAAIPYHNTNVTANLGVVADFSDEELQDLENKRISVVGKDASEYNVLVGDVFTLNRTDSQGNLDNTFKYLSIVDVALCSREYFFNNLKKDFAQSTIVRSKSIPGRGQINLGDINVKMVRYYQNLLELGIAHDSANFEDSLNISFDFSSGLIKINWILYPVQGVYAINGALAIKLD
jgi:hypothetical protein